jgi:molybdate transport system substrate-binding protein
VGSLALAVLMVVPAASGIARSASPASPGLSTCSASSEAPTVTPLASASASAGSAGVPVVAATGELTVFGAASLRGAFEALAPTVEAATGVTPIFSFDASSALRAQIEQGAPADVFASADTANVVTLLGAGLATEPVVFACNQLTVIVPVGNPAGITSARDLGRTGVRVVAAGDEVPITRYATQLAEHLGIADGYAANIVSREDNVAAVRARIELGEGDAAIVYRTDALASGDALEQVPVPPEANVPATYAAAVVSATDQPHEAAGFLGWLTGPQGQAALSTFGFLPSP